MAFGFPEWLSLFYFGFFSTLAWLRPLERKYRLNATGLGAAAIALLSLIVLANDPRFVTFQRILPLFLIPMAYWQTGQFRAPLNRRLQAALEAIDRKIFYAGQGLRLPGRLRRWLRVYFEYAYFFCYPMVPSGLAVLYFAGAIEHVSEFWSVVLLPTYLCYATLPFVRTLPPRALEEPGELDAQRTGIRRFNLFVVGHVTHQANTFPSGHAAAGVAVALELIRLALPAGVIYSVIAVSIMMGAFVGRYHYAGDVLLGGAIAGVSFLLIIL